MSDCGKGAQEAAWVRGRERRRPVWMRRQAPKTCSGGKAGITDLRGLEGMRTRERHECEDMTFESGAGKA